MGTGISICSGSFFEGDYTSAQALKALRPASIAARAVGRGAYQLAELAVTFAAAAAPGVCAAVRMCLCYSRPATLVALLMQPLCTIAAVPGVAEPAAQIIQPAPMDAKNVLLIIVCRFGPVIAPSKPANSGLRHGPRWTI